MTMLSDKTICHLAGFGALVINPFDVRHLQPASYDLGAGESFIIQPGEFRLTWVKEYIRLPDTIAARIEGKSTWGRRGLLVHATAGFVDPGFKGFLQLECYNLSKEPIEVREGERISQLSFTYLDRPCERPYGHPDLGSRYQDQPAGVVPARGKPNHD